MCEIFAILFGLITVLALIAYIPLTLLQCVVRYSARKQASLIISRKKKAKLKSICRIIDTLSQDLSGKKRKYLPEKDRWLIEQLRSNTLIEKPSANTSDEINTTVKTGVVYSFFRLCRLIIILVVIFLITIVAISLFLNLPMSPTSEQSRDNVTQERPKVNVETNTLVTKNEEIPPQQKPIKADAPKEFYLRIAFFNETETEPITKEEITRRLRRARPNISRPLSPNCRMWIRGFGDFYPARDTMWEFGGAVIEKAGPFDVNNTHMIYFYPDYSDERRVFKVPFKYSAKMNPEGSVKDMLTITVNNRTIDFCGIPIENVKGELEYKFSRKTFMRID